LIFTHISPGKIGLERRVSGDAPAASLGGAISKKKPCIA